MMNMHRLLQRFVCTSNKDHVIIIASENIKVPFAVGTDYRRLRQ